MSASVFLCLTVSVCLYPLQFFSPEIEGAMHDVPHSPVCKSYPRKRRTPRCRGPLGSTSNRNICDFVPMFGLVLGFGSIRCVLYAGGYGTRFLACRLRIQGSVDRKGRWINEENCWPPWVHRENKLCCLVLLNPQRFYFVVFMELTFSCMLEGYGLSESSPLTHTTPHDTSRIDSIGVPVPNIVAKV